MKYIMTASFSICLSANFPSTQRLSPSSTILLFPKAMLMSLLLMVPTYLLFSSSVNLFIFLYSLALDCSVAKA